MKIRFFLASMSLMFSLAIGAVDTLFYYCKSDKIDLAFFQILSDQQNFLEGEFDGYEIKTKKPVVTNRERWITVAATDKSKTRQISLTLAKPENPSQKPNERGAVDYQQNFKSLLLVTDERDIKGYQLSCEIYGLNENFFDELCVGLFD